MMQRILENTNGEVNFSFVIGLQLLAVIVEEKLNRRYFSNISVQFRKAPLFSCCSDINWRREYYEKCVTGNNKDTSLTSLISF